MEQRRTQLRVIQGGGSTASTLFELPSIVIARSPASKARLVGFRLATGEARRALEHNRRQPVYDLWSGVLGVVPPQAGASLQSPNGEIVALSGINTAHACFRGIRRPVGHDEHGFDYLAYVHKAPYRFSYIPSMGRCVQLVRVPDDLLFVPYVKLDFPEGRPYGKRQSKKASVMGVVTHWDYVEADSEAPDLPLDHQTRFRRREW